VPDITIRPGLDDRLIRMNCNFKREIAAKERDGI
jgi:hypothetical protein